MQIQVKSVCSRISTSKESFIQQINIVKISTNYEKPRQSVARIQLILNLLTTTRVAPPSNASKWQMGFNSAFKGLIKSYWKSRTASNSSCIFLERDPCLRRATKIVATEVGQVKQTVTTASHSISLPSTLWWAV